MNRNVMIVLAGGFLIAILVALLVKASLSGGGEVAPEPVVLAEEPKVEIVVAAEELPIGAELTEDNMKWQKWPKGAIFPGAIQREDDKEPLEMVEGRTIRRITEGEPITTSALVSEAGVNLVTASLEKGMRAYTVKVSAESMVAGFATPGDYVDVLVTYRKSISYAGPDNPDIENVIEMNLDKFATETILQNVKVLAVDQSPVRDEEGGIRVGKTVTLEVSFVNAEVLAMAAKMGDITLSLRGIGDDSVVQRGGPITTDARITNIYKEVLQEIEREEVNSGQVTDIVRIYRGEVAEEVPVRQ